MNDDNYKLNGFEFDQNETEKYAKVTQLDNGYVKVEKATVSQMDRMGRPHYSANWSPSRYYKVSGKTRLTCYTTESSPSTDRNYYSWGLTLRTYGVSTIAFVLRSFTYRTSFEGHPSHLYETLLSWSTGFSNFNKQEICIFTCRRWLAKQRRR